MTRTLKMLSTLVLGGMLLATTACEDKECKDALAKQTAAVEAGAKAQAAVTAELNATKAKLAAKDAELAQVKKDLDAAKAAAKPEEPAPAETPKKGKKK